MNSKYKFRIKQFKDGEAYLFLNELPKEFGPIGGLIGDFSNGHQEEHLLGFVKNIIAGGEKQECYGEGYAAELVEYEGRKMFKIFFHLTKNCELGYISPEDFKELLEIWIRERSEFEKDPEAYKEKLKKNGGIVED